MRAKTYLGISTWLLLLLLLLPTTSMATDPVRLSRGETVYVPVYANVFSAPRAVPFNLATILSVRNTDMQQGLDLVSADFYDTEGHLLKKYLPEPKHLRPLESTHIYLSEKESQGGVGANFIIRWRSAQEINAPIVECVMIGATSGQGISFVSPGRIIREAQP